MAINNIRTEPGVFSQFQPTRTFPVLSGGVRVTALVGAGRTTNLVSGETVTKGTLNGQDALAHDAVALGATITDEDFNTYNLDVDYQLTSNEVDWSLTGPASVTGTVVSPFAASLVGQTIKITVGGGVEQSYTFVSGDFGIPGAPRADEVKDAINANITGVTCTGSASVGSPVTIATTAGDNTSLLIGDGTSDATLGFTAGTFLVTPREPASGKKYTVGYQYAKVSADYVPTFFFNMTDIINAYGDVSTANTLSLGSEIVFEQGASAVCLIQINPADGALSNQFRKAIDKLLTVSNINIVVPLSTDTTLHAYLSAHCNQASSITERKERTGIVAMPDPQTVSSLSSEAQAIFNKRIVLVSPTSVTRFVGSDSVASTLNGSFIAAAVAGERTSTTYDVAEPATRKQLVGFDNMPDTLLRAEKVLLLGNGVMVIQNKSGVISIVQQVTTDTSTRENSEYSVVESIDFVASNMRELLEQIYIGKKLLAGTPSQVKATITLVLNSLKSSETIVSFANVQASIDNLDPTQINVSFEIAPVFPTNFILITFSLSPNQ